MLSVVLDRLFDLLVMAAFGTLGIFALGRLLPSRELQTALVLAMALGLAALTVVLVARGPRTWMLTVALPRFAPGFTATLSRWNSQLHGLSLRPALIIELTLLSLGSAAFTFLRLWLLFLALGLDRVPLPVVVGVSALIARAPGPANLDCRRGRARRGADRCTPAIWIPDRAGPGALGALSADQCAAYCGRLYCLLLVPPGSAARTGN